MFHVLLILDYLLFNYMHIALWLSWNFTDEMGAIPWDLRNFCVHNICGITSLTPTLSTLVNLLVLILSLVFV